MTKGLILRTNGKVEPIEINGLSDLQEAVDGLIAVCTSGPDWVLWANDEGRIRELPLNQVAREFVAEVADCPIEQVLSLHGDMVLVGDNPETGSRVDVPDEIGTIALGKALFNEPFIVLKTQNEDGTSNNDVIV